MEYWPILLLGGLTLILFFIISYACQRTKIPSVLIYIVAGIIFSSFIFQDDLLHSIAEIGIVLLFFLLGLEFPLTRMMSIAKRVWPAGLLDVILNLGVGFAIAYLFGLDLLTAFLIGAVVYATSSSITAKMLEEKRRLVNPESEFILALLIFEDLVAPILVSFLAGIYAGVDPNPTFILSLLGKIVLMTVGAIVIGYYGFSRLTDFVEHYSDKDFMPLLTVGVAFAYAGLAMYMGLSEILGAFLAGVMLSETRKSQVIEHLLLPLRDLTLPFFFFWFGTSITFGDQGLMLGLLVVLVVWSLIGKIAVGYYGGKLYGLSPKVALRAGFSLGQRGEFSAVIAALAPPPLRVFSGIYILATAFIGVAMFNHAPKWSKWVNEKFMQGKSSK